MWLSYFEEVLTRVWAWFFIGWLHNYGSVWSISGQTDRLLKDPALRVPNFFTEEVHPITDPHFWPPLAPSCSSSVYLHFYGFDISTVRKVSGNFGNPPSWNWSQAMSVELPGNQNLESAQSMYEGDLVEEGVPGSSSVNRNRIIVSEALYKLGDLGWLKTDLGAGKSFQTLEQVLAARSPFPQLWLYSDKHSISDVLFVVPDRNSHLWLGHCQDQYLKTCSSPSSPSSSSSSCSPQDLVKSDPLNGIVGEHGVNEREQLFVLLLVGLLVLLKNYHRDQFDHCGHLHFDHRSLGWVAITSEKSLSWSSSTRSSSLSSSSSCQPWATCSFLGRICLQIIKLYLIQNCIVFVFACRAVLVPHEFPSLEVLRLRAPRHPAMDIDCCGQNLAEWVHGTITRNITRRQRQKQKQRQRQTPRHPAMDKVAVSTSQHWVTT